MSDWVVVAVKPKAQWVQAETVVTFRQRELMLRPHDDRGCYPDVSIGRQSTESYYAAATLVHRFLSVIVWRRRESVRVVGHTGGSERFRVGGRNEDRDFRITILPGYEFEDLPIKTTPEWDLALALYREALGLNSEPYRFLALFKILNITLTTMELELGLPEEG